MIKLYLLTMQVLMQTGHKGVGSGGQLECVRRVVARHGVAGLYKGSLAQARCTKTGFACPRELNIN